FRDRRLLGAALRARQRRRDRFLRRNRPRCQPRRPQRPLRVRGCSFARRRLAMHAPSAVVMVRPHHFDVNPATAADNVFQTEPDAPSSALAKPAFDEVTALASALEAEGVTVHLFEDERDDRPDSVFPNNWVSTHIGGHVALFPMFAPNRRIERRSDVVDLLKAKYRVQDVIDYSGLEHDDIFLEGTGAMVLDNDERVAYVARSNRAT